MATSVSEPRQRSQPQALFTPEFLLLMATGVMFSLGMGGMNALLPPYVVEELGGTEAIAGTVMGSLAITALFSRAFLGRVADRRGARLLISVGAAVSALSMVILVAWPSVTGAIVSRLVMGGGNAAFFIGTTVRAMELAPESRRSQGAAFHLIAFHIGMGLGPTLLEWVLNASSHATAWVVVGVLNTVAVALSLGLSHRPGDPDVEPSPLIHEGAIWPGVVTFFGVVAFNGFMVFAALYAKDLGLGAVGPVFLVSSGTMILARVFLGRVPDIIGPIRAGSGALVMTVLAASVLALWSAPAGLYVGAALVALGLSLQSPSFMVIVVEGATERQRGSAMATYTAFYDIANALIGPVLGAIIAVSSYRSAFLAAAGSAVIGLILLQLVVAPRWRKSLA